MTNSSFFQKMRAWSVHLFTALGAIAALFAVDAVYHQNYILMFWFIAFSIVVDALDGTLARAAHVKTFAPYFDGALLDNMVDYINYVFVPAIFLLQSNMLPEGWRGIGACLILLTSAYQFCQQDAKTPDHFFKGFPSYWNIVIFYLFFFQVTAWLALIIIFVLAVFVFVPIKYVYPSRLDHLTYNPILRKTMLFATICWGIASAGLLALYPDTNHWLLFVSLSYMIFYVAISVYRTFYPLEAR